MAEITVAGLADAEALNDDNMFLVSQPEAYNPFTQSPGDTRKVTLSKLTQYFDQDFDQNYVSRKPMTGAQVLKSHLALDKGKELLGTKADGAQANLAALKTYNEGLPDQIEQVEIGSETEHLNLNTNETGEYGNRISVDTKDPATHQPKKEILAYESFVTSPADQVDGTGRDLLKVLGAAGIQAAMDALQARCNGTGTPDFSGLMVGDYLDGLNLSAIPAENGGVAGQAWNDSYKNNRIVLSGFNTYKGCGDTEVTKNHILFTFRNCPITKRINPTDDNTGGYAASELRAFLEGANGDGTGDYAGAGIV
ncbi:MAG: hypothetical protein LBS57_13980, partial [Treponema sp.]|nr:hypothetical protein [Treponema sp.]